MRILVTGGAGFIGYHLSKRLAETGHEVVIVDNLQRGRFDADFSALAARENVTFLKADMIEPSTYEALTGAFDQVYHLAAVNGTRNFYAAPYDVLRTDTLSEILLLDWLASRPWKARVLFTSSCEAYAGALDAFGVLPLPTPEDVPLVVHDPYNPRWSYAGSKIVGEQLLIHHAARHAYPALIVRPHNFYGPREGFDHVIPEFVCRALDRVDPFPIHGATETRAFCYIDDAVTAMIRLMDELPLLPGRTEIVNVGSSKEVVISDLAQAVFASAGWTPSRVASNAAPAGCVKRRATDIAKIKGLIGWEPTTSLSEGLARTFDWYAKAERPVNIATA